MDELAKRPVVQTTHKPRILVYQSIGCTLRVAHDDDRTNRFRRSDPDAGSRQTETIAGKAEFGDMAAAIGTPAWTRASPWTGKPTSFLMTATASLSAVPRARYSTSST